MASNKSRDLLLRAVLHHGDARIIAHTAELSMSYVLVQTEHRAGIGDRVVVDLSFPGLVSPFSVETQVIASKLSLGPGDAGALTLGFLFYSQAERRVVEGLLEGKEPADDEFGGPDGRAYRVLIVEDSQFVRDAFAFGLDRLVPNPPGGVSVDLVSDSADALDRLFAEHYDLAIVDYFLPNANGDRLISRLRGNPSLSRLPIFAFSGGGEDVRQASLDAGADLFLHKPVIMRQLFPTLVQLSTLRVARDVPNPR